MTQLKNETPKKTRFQKVLENARKRIRNEPSTPPPALPPTPVSSLRDLVRKHLKTTGHSTGVSIKTLHSRPTRPPTLFHHLHRQKTNPRTKSIQKTNPISRPLKMRPTPLKKRESMESSHPNLSAQTRFQPSVVVRLDASGGSKSTIRCYAHLVFGRLSCRVENSTCFSCGELTRNNIKIS